MARYEVLQVPFGMAVADVYQTDFHRLAGRFDYPPADKSSWVRRSMWLRENPAARPDNRMRAQVAQALVQLNRAYGADREALLQAEKLASAETLAVVTGQQTGLWTGPLYTLYKAATALRSAAKAREILRVPVVAVFFLAGEDHDYEEVRGSHLLFDDGRLAHYRLADPGPQQAPVADRPLPRSRAGESVAPGSVEALLSDLAEDLQASTNRFRSDVKARADQWVAFLRESADESTSLVDWTGHMLARLFSRHGLVLINPSMRELRSQGSRFYTFAVEHAREIAAAAVSGAEAVRSLKLPVQVEKDEDHLHLFARTAQGARRPLFAREQDLDLLARKVHATPQQYSPDVLLRPLWQDEILPTLAYVAGPGEIGYYAQLQETYRVFGRTMPIITPRLSVTLLRPEEAALWRAWRPWLEEQPFIDGRELIRKVMQYEDGRGFQLQKAFDRWKRDRLQADREWVDHLRRMGGETADRVQRLLREESVHTENLFEVVWSAWLSRNRTAVDELRRLNRALLPMGNRQERYLNVLPYLIGYGVDWLDTLAGNASLPCSSLDARHIVLFLEREATNGNEGASRPAG